MRSEVRMPDFIIAGAMKCGTTTLHKMLSHHPDIFIPEREIHFFNMDDIKQHPDFFQNHEGEWFYPQFNENLQKYLEWYQSYFSDAEQQHVIGEDSTTYLASEQSAERIAKFNPNAKIIIMLRDPASRTYSHYWHLVRTGRAMWDFEKTLQIMPDNLIQRSLYKNQIEAFFSHIPQNNIHIIVFENFINNIAQEFKKACHFIGVEPYQIDNDLINTHHNPARIPKNFPLQLWRNRIMRIYANQKYSGRLHYIKRQSQEKLLLKWFDKMHRKINPLQKVSPQKMQNGTRQFLDNYFREANKGLEELIGQSPIGWYKSLVN